MKEVVEYLRSQNDFRTFALFGEHEVLSRKFSVNLLA